MGLGLHKYLRSPIVAHLEVQTFAMLTGVCVYVKYQLHVTLRISHCENKLTNTVCMKDQHR